MYIHTDTTWGNRKEIEKTEKKHKKKKEEKGKKRKNISDYMNAKALGLNCRKREKRDNVSLLRFQ